MNSHYRPGRPWNPPASAPQKTTTLGLCQSPNLTSLLFWFLFYLFDILKLMCFLWKRSWEYFLSSPMLVTITLCLKVTFAEYEILASCFLSSTVLKPLFHILCSQSLINVFVLVLWILRFIFNYILVCKSVRGMHLFLELGPHTWAQVFMELCTSTLLSTFLLLW